MRQDARNEPEYVQSPPPSPYHAMRASAFENEESAVATPRRHELHTEFMMVPPAPGMETKRPDLLEALRHDSVTRVEQVLKNDPGTAKMPFFDHGCESPLHVAVQALCCPEIIELLLLHGASVNDVNMGGQTPLQVIEEMRAAQDCAFFFADFDPCGTKARCDAIAEVVKVAGGKTRPGVPS